MTDQELLEHLNSGLAEFAKVYSANPYHCLFESDVQTLLTGILKDQFKGISHLVKFKMSSGAEQTIDIGKVHTEYPYAQKFDIVILGEPTDDSPYHQEIAVAIELKLIHHGVNGSWIFDTPKEDLIRLAKKFEALNKPRNALKFVQLSVFQEKIQQLKSIELHRNTAWTRELIDILTVNEKLYYQAVNLEAGAIYNVLKNTY